MRLSANLSLLFTEVALKQRFALARQAGFLYQVTRTETDLVAAIDLAGQRIGHVQFADNPGRQEPGTGNVDFTAALAALRRAGYAGVIAAEYRPWESTLASLGWMAAWGHVRDADEKPAGKKPA